MKSIKILFFQFFIIIILLLVLDLFYTRFFVTVNIFSENYIQPKKEYRIKNKYFHHTLSKSYDGIGIWEYRKHKLCTDKSGFKSSCNNIDKLTKHFDIAFIGDSFTEAVGMTFEDSFVGMYANKYKDLVIGNFAVGSYSPTIYLAKIKWLIENGYTFNHLYVFVDIGDIQDESKYFNTNDGRVIRYVKVNNVKDTKEKINKLGLEKFIKNNFYLFTQAYLNLNYYFRVNFYPDNYGIFSLQSSAWTKNFDIQGYEGISGLGVRGSIIKAKKKMTDLHTYLESKGIKLSVAIYPWPEQLLEMRDHPEKLNKQSFIWREFCQNRCKFFIDTFPIFNELVIKHGVSSVYNRYYLKGDVHFNKQGNKLIFKILDDNLR